MLRSALRRLGGLSVCILVGAFVLWLRGSSINTDNRDVITGLYAGLLAMFAMWMFDTVMDHVEKRRAAARRD